MVKKNFSLKLAGYTDNVGSDDANMKLSKDRAAAVKDYLVSKGANHHKLKQQVMAKHNPLLLIKQQQAEQKTEE